MATLSHSDMQTEPGEETAVREGASARVCFSRVSVVLLVCCVNVVCEYMCLSIGVHVCVCVCVHSCMYICVCVRVE